MVLDKIQKENDIKKLTDEELADLAAEIRNFLVENISNILPVSNKTYILSFLIIILKSILYLLYNSKISS